MPKNIIIGITASVFVCFGLLLSVGMAIEAKDQAYNIEWEQSELESRIEKLERNRGRY